MQQAKKTNRPPVQSLHFKEAWELLSDKQKEYAYHFTNASWAGGLIYLHQISYEAPAIFLFLQSFFSVPMVTLKSKFQKESSIAVDAWENFLIYSGKFYGNLGNYNSFGNNKILPSLSEEDFKKIVELHPKYQDESSFYRKVAVDQLLPQVWKEIFIDTPPYSNIGFSDKNGVTAYYSSNFNESDRKLIDNFAASQNISLLNTRAFKHENAKYLITVASAQVPLEPKVYEFQDASITVQYGEFSPYLVEVVNHLKKALSFTRSDIQQEMLKAYISHFENGSIQMHKTSQRHWIKDDSPPIETNIGFIETYLDPANVRAYFESIVAIVDAQKSKKFQQLVQKSTQIIPLLPWEPQMEKENFLKPDFTSLEVICFASGGCPLGINIPNYDDIRQEEGFKNVYLYNSFPKITSKSCNFATPHQRELLLNYSEKVYLLHVALHELLGHGVGKLFFKNQDGTFNFPHDTFLNPLTGEKISTWYEHNETWNSKFGQVSTSYEECRADTNGIWLSAYADCQKIFNFDPAKDRQIIAEVQWLQYVRKGILGLIYYDQKNKKWGQAHVNGAFVFLSFMLQNQDPEHKVVDILIKKVTEKQLQEMDEEQKSTFKGDETFEIVLNVENILNEKYGRKLVRDMLMFLQTYKTLGDVENGTKWYHKYSQVSDKFLKIREIVKKNMGQRRIQFYNNLIRKENEIQARHYEVSIEGVIQSFQDRYELDSKSGIAQAVIDVWNQSKKDLRVNI